MDFCTHAKFVTAGRYINCESNLPGEQTHHAWPHSIIVPGYRNKGIMSIRQLNMRHVILMIRLFQRKAVRYLGVYFSAAIVTIESMGVTLPCHALVKKNKNP